MKRINIMTSCDGNLMKFIPIQLEAIADNLADRNIDFYIFHDGTNMDYVNKLKALDYKNIIVHDVIVKNTQLYEKIAKKGGDWCGAAYYSLCAWQYLPADMDRILYIDSGDVLIIGNIDEYYFADFEGKSLMATSISFKLEDDKPALFNREDMFNGTYLSAIARGLFNSGSYMINLNKMRQNHYNLEEYTRWSELVPMNYFGDQGFLSLVFVGDIKFFNHSQEIDLLYMPYNFCLWYFDKSPHQLNYQPAIVHFIGDKVFKPWKGKYPKLLEHFQVEDELHDLNELNHKQIEYYNLWYKYATMSKKVF